MGGDKDNLFSIWQELLGVAISRSLSKGINAVTGVYEPFASLMQEISLEVGSVRYVGLVWRLCIRRAYLTG